MWAGWKKGNLSASLFPCLRDGSFTVQLSRLRAIPIPIRGSTEFGYCRTHRRGWAAEAAPAVVAAVGRGGGYRCAGVG